MIEIKIADKKHIPIIRELAEVLWPATFAPILSDKQIEYMMGMMYSHDSLEKQMDSGNQYSIAVENGVNIGYVAFELNHNKKNKTKIHKLYILPQHQRKGAGKIIIEYVAKEAIKSNNNAVFLNVNKHNQSAIDFYQKHNFFLLKKEVIDIGNGFIMDDFVFELEMKELKY